jgi:hypothetical protein
MTVNFERNALYLVCDNRTIPHGKEGKFVPVQATKAYSGVKLQLSLFLTSALDGSSGLLHASAASPLGKEPRYPLNRWLGDHQSRSGRFWRRENLLPRQEPRHAQTVASRSAE